MPPGRSCFAGRPAFRLLATMPRPANSAAASDFPGADDVTSPCKSRRIISPVTVTKNVTKRTKNSLRTDHLDQHEQKRISFTRWVLTDSGEVAKTAVVDF